MKRKDKQKIQLNEVTFCIPIRIESGYRKRNLYTLLKYLENHFDTHYIIVEADEEKRVTPPKNIRNLSYKFIMDDKRIFHRTKYINRLLDMTRTPYAAIWDTDAMAPPEQIEEACKTLRNTGATMVYPFSGAFYEINEELSDFFCLNPNIRMLNNPALSKFLLNGYYSVGGAYMVNVKKYRQAGGENQHFFGWGPEDSERIARMQILGEKVERINGPMYHLFHTRGHNSNYASTKTAIQTKKEFCKICGMTTEELKKYIDTWDW